MAAGALGGTVLMIVLAVVLLDEGSASAVIVGELAGQGEYTVQGTFQKVNRVWRIAPAAGTDGCSAFNRLSS